MHANRGFTLLEALVVAVVAAVLLSVASPALDGLVGSTRVTAASNGFLGDLLLTRSEAIKRRVRAVMCKSADGRTCSPSGGWQQGWIVFADTDGDGLRGGAEPLIRVQPELAGSLRLTGTSPVARYVSYAPTGATRTVGGGFQAGTLTICSTSAQPVTARKVIINANGRPRTQAVEVPSCR